MADQGWVEVQTIQSENRPPRRVYSLTEMGREELRRWLTTLLPPEEVRIPWLIQVFFAGQLSDDEILAIFERVAAQMRARLERACKVPEVSADYVKVVDSPRETFFWMLTLDYRIAVMQAELAWIEEAIRRLQRKEQPPAEQQQHQIHVALD
nr:PadR family transcriptional regulator [Chloroflexota bacterium]